MLSSFFGLPLLRFAVMTVSILRELERLRRLLAARSGKKWQKKPPDAWWKDESVAEATSRREPVEQLGVGPGSRPYLSLDRGVSAQLGLSNR